MSSIGCCSRSLDTPKFDSLLFELGVFTALVIALVGALYFTGCVGHGRSSDAES